MKWWWTKAPEEPIVEFDPHPPGGEWCCWMFQSPYALYPPYGHQLLELWRREWENETHFVRISALPPKFNVLGLWWRPA